MSNQWLLSVSDGGTPYEASSKVNTGLRKKPDAIFCLSYTLSVGLRLRPLWNATSHLKVELTEWVTPPETSSVNFFLMLGKKIKRKKPRFAPNKKGTCEKLNKCP